jgi:hypothetical protein
MASLGVSKTQEQQWQAQDDARVMAQYQEIIGDKSRMNRAIKEASKQATDLSKRANAMRSAANVKSTGGGISRRKK